MEGLEQPVVPPPSLGPLTKWPGAHLESGESPAVNGLKCRRVGFQYPHLVQRVGTTPYLPDSWVEGCSKSDTASSPTAMGKADLRLCFPTARKPRNRHILETCANLNSEETHSVTREELPAQSTGSTVPLN